MRHTQPGLLQHCPTEQNQVQVQRARCTLVWAAAAARVFDRAESREQVPGTERGLADDGSVEKIWLG